MKTRMIAMVLNMTLIFSMVVLHSATVNATASRYDFSPVESGWTTPDKNKNMVFATTGDFRIQKVNNIDTYLKFKVSGFNGDVNDATLRLTLTYPIQGNIPINYSIFTISPEWTAKSFDTANLPSVNKDIAKVIVNEGKVAGDALDVDVTSIFKGDGIYAIKISGIGSQQTRFKTPMLIINKGAESAPEQVLDADKLIEAVKVEQSEISKKLDESPNWPDPWTDQPFSNWPLAKSIAPELEVTQLVKNPSFKDGLKYWNINGTVVIDNTDTHSFMSSAKISAGSTISQEFTVDIRNTYTFSYWTKFTSNPQIKVTELNETGVAVASSEIFMDGSEWKNYMRCFGYSENGTVDKAFHPATKKILLTFTAGENDILVDDVSFDVGIPPFKVSILSKGYPRFYQFRDAELTLGPQRKYNNYEEWFNAFKDYDALEGKALDEEIPMHDVAKFFTKYKQQYPEKMILLHYNGRTTTMSFNELAQTFPNHLQTFAGCKMLSNISAETGDLKIGVKDASKFLIKKGSEKDSNDIIVVARLAPDGKPDWKYSEYMLVLDTDTQNNTITVKRSLGGSEPKEFKGGESYIAIVNSQPFIAKQNRIYTLNFSTESPKDQHGRNTIDWYVDSLVDVFSPSGSLNRFDGVQFDVFVPSTGVWPRGSIDANGDGVADGGIIKGIDTYANGNNEIGIKLRQKLGYNKIIMADGMSSGFRNFEIFNGIESEGWPIMRDTKILDWSGGVNRHLFWNENSFGPSANYSVYKYRIAKVDQDMPYHNLRLFASTLVALDATLSGDVRMQFNMGDYKLGIMDEYIKGVENQKGWLGQPLGNIKRLAKETPDIFTDTGKTLSDAFINQISINGGELKKEGNKLLVDINNPLGKSVTLDQADEQGTVAKSQIKMGVVTIADIPVTGPDLSIFFKIKAEPEKAMMSNNARLVYVRAYDETNKMIREFTTWANMKDFEAGFYFRDVTGSKVRLEISIQGEGKVWFSDFTAHEYPDIISKEFENGIVVTNPSMHDVVVELSKIYPNRTFRHIQGSPEQDPKTNDGSQVKSLKLMQLDGAFLIANEPIKKHTDGEICEQFGMLKGDGNGVTPFYLNKIPTRIQAALLYLRLKGLEIEAENFTGAENFEDSNQEEWAKPYMAYLKAHPEYGMIGVGDNKFAPSKPISSKEYTKILLETLGYRYNIDFTWDNVLDFASDIGIKKTALYNDYRISQIATATVEALKATLKDQSTSFADDIISKQKKLQSLKDLIN